ncbi:MAG: hypothetical protein IPK16_16420 [Anaerolineales bacterium]|nr:hypothetical protein [Anaerolineales bacterium]
MEGETREERTLVEILRTTLPGATVAVDALEWQSVDWGQVVALARLQGLSPLLFRALKDLGPDWLVPSPWMIQLFGDYSSTVRTNLLRFRERRLARDL